MRRSIAKMLMMSGGLCVMFAGGCANAPAKSQSVRDPSLGSSLVMQPTNDSIDSIDAVSDWTDSSFGRNDHRLGSYGDDRVATIEILEVRQRDYLRTINGRPREFSTTNTFSLKRGIVR